MPKPPRRFHPLSTPRSNQRSVSWHDRGYLPHRDSDQLLQFITFRLQDSVPSETIQSWKDQLNWRAGLPSFDPVNIALQQKIQEFEDLGHGACANRILNESGEFWMRDYFDRFMRDEKHYDDVVKYIHSQESQVVAESV